MNLRCKVFRASDAGVLEAAINRFLTEELSELGPVQFEEISQSEGESGVTVVVWYALVTPSRAALDDELDESYEEIDGKELA